MTRIAEDLLCEVDEIKSMSDRELLEAVWRVESIYKERFDTSDHRQYLSRHQLENVYHLVCRRARLRLDAVGT